ncbi:DNA-binding response regulator, NarL/FixJ family, contains REC and HTH domains [Micromonospora viridifaciens]|uniref:DNA-binding response regulator, NarL/FixJ family, contains REC and HTH domains n=1 Tax=Micromonospora viridifaciens TaxID=1881 RepID=A0A1C4XRZ1_MICVI|nr:response regulator transcription factor [Micromonospora viridifaciens]SCF11257.1 DNA-binding response regulator, NarL/FixJ family, contains REC and HTH domains [Micromonospora viridifaciens]
MTTPLRLVLVDDHPVVRAGLRALLGGRPDMAVVAEAATADDAVRQAAALRPDVVLMDLQLGTGADGVTATERLLALPDPPRVLVLTTYDTEEDILRAIEAGATGYLLKDCPPDELFRAVDAAAAGQTVLSPPVAARLMDRMRGPRTTLSSREVEILTLVARGHANKEISRRLFISEATVKTHLVHIYAKLGVDSRTAAVHAAVERKLIRL